MEATILTSGPQYLEGNKTYEFPNLLGPTELDYDIILSVTELAAGSTLILTGSFFGGAPDFSFAPVTKATNYQVVRAHSNRDRFLSLYWKTLNVAALAGSTKEIPSAYTGPFPPTLAYAHHVFGITMRTAKK